MGRASRTTWRGGLLAAALLGVGCSMLAGLGNYGQARATGGLGGDGATGGGGAGGGALGGGGTSTAVDCMLDGQDVAWDPAMVQTLSATQDARATAVGTDGKRRLVVGGWYVGELHDGDPSPEERALCPDSAATRSAFIARWSADGSERDVFCLGDATGDQEVVALTVADDDTIFVGGRFVGDYASLPTPLFATEASGMVLALEPGDLTVVASEQIGLDGEQRVSALLMSRPGLWVGGWFDQDLLIGNDVEANGGTVTLDAFVVSMPLDLSSVLSATTAGNETEDSAITGLGYDEASDRLVVGGFFGGDVDLDGIDVSSLGARDGFVGSLGASKWVAQLGGSLAERVSDIALGPAGDVYLVGSYQTDGATLTDAAAEPVSLPDDGADTVESGVVAALTAEGEHRWHHWLTSANGPFNFYTIATDGTYVLYGGSYKTLGSNQGGSLCEDETPCGDLLLPNNTTRSALLAIYDAAEGSTSALRLGQGTQDAYVRDITFDVCGSAVVVLEYSGTMSFGKTLPELANGIAVARLFRPSPR